MRATPDPNLIFDVQNQLSDPMRGDAPDFARPAEAAKAPRWLFDPSNLAAVAPNGRRVELQEKTASVLSLLIERCGEILSRDEIMSAVWPDTVVSDDSLYRCIHQLRTEFRRSGAQGPSISTVRNRGYRLERMPSIVTVPGGSIGAMPGTDAECRATADRPAAYRVALRRAAPAVILTWIAALAAVLIPGAGKTALNGSNLSAEHDNALLSVVFLDSLEESDYLDGGAGIEFVDARADSIIGGLKVVRPGFSWSADTDSMPTHP